jgi:hypothetical protein
MEYIQFATMFLSLVGLFVWNRTESRADIRHMDNKIDSIRELVHAIHSEMKDFHNRLCAIAERNKK